MRSAGASITTDCESCRNHHRLLGFALGFSVMACAVSILVIPLGLSGSRAVG